MAQIFAANVYGLVQGGPPYGEGIGSPSRLIEFNSPLSMNFPSNGVVLHPVDPGIRVGNSSNYIYGVIEVPATGLKVHSDKYASNQSPATLATLANAG